MKAKHHLPIIFAATVVILMTLSGTASASVRWQANYPGSNIKGWYTVECGGQGLTCPCTAGNFDYPAGATNYQAGQCPTSTTNLPTPSGSRFQVVTDPVDATKVNTLQFNLREGDILPDGFSTTRNELAFTQETAGTYKTYVEGDDRYFAWSSYFPSAGFAAWSCDTSADTACLNDVGSFNPWNIFTQWHASPPGPQLILMALRRHLSSDHAYRALLAFGTSSTDYEAWNEGSSALQTNTWYDFVVHLKFSTSPSTGVLELWLGKNGETKTKQTLSCGGASASLCTLSADTKTINIQTMSLPYQYFKQGLYRTKSLNNNVNIYHKGTIVGDTYADVTSDYALFTNPTSVSSTTGGSASTTVSVSSQGGFAGSASLSGTVSPSGPTLSFSPNSVTLASGGTSTSTMTINAGAAPAGTYVATVTAASGVFSHATNVIYTVTAGTPRDPSVANLSDAFAGTTINPSLWSTSAVNESVSMSGGALQMSPNPSTGSAQGIVRSMKTYSLLNSSFMAKVPGVLSAAGSVDQQMSLYVDSSNSIRFIYQSGSLYIQKVVSGTLTTIATITYSSTNHAWWRFRHSGITVYWETSPDGTTWTTQASAAASGLFSLNSLEVHFYVESYGSGNPSPGTAQFSNLNIVPGGSSPSIANVADVFTGTSVNTKLWATSQMNGAITESGGTLNLTPNANTGSAALSVYSLKNYSLAGSSVFTKAVGVVDAGGNVDNDFSLLLDGSNYIKWLYQGGTLYAMASVGGTVSYVATLTYSPTSHLWWRIRESGGTVFWDTSADGVTWTNRASRTVASLFNVTYLRVFFYAETYGPGSATPGVAKFANFNVASAANPSTSTLIDAFTGSAIDSAQWTIALTLGTVVESGGDLSLTPNASSGTTSLSVASVADFSLTGSVSSVQSDSCVSTAGNVNNSLRIYQTGGAGQNEVNWWCETGNLYAIKKVAGVQTIIATLAYSQPTFAWWRIRESGGTVFWDTSSDGVIWTQRASQLVSGLFSIGQVRVELHATTFGSGLAAPGVAKYANFNN